MRSNARHQGLLAALFVGSLAWCGCTPARADSDSEAAYRRGVDQSLVQLQDAARAQAADRATIADLTAEVAALDRRLDIAETRLGLREYAPVALKAAPRRTQVRWSDAQRVDSQSARPKTANLGRETSRYAASVIAVWATWCKPCTSPEERVHLRHLRGALRQEGLGFVSLAVDGLAKVRGDSRASTWLYPLYQQDDGHIEMLPKAFIQKVGLGLPLFLVVDSTGRLTHYRGAALDIAAVNELVTAGLAAARK